MPQLMPLNWNVSFILVGLMLFMMIMFYFVEMEKGMCLDGELEDKMMESWWW